MTVRFRKLTGRAVAALEYEAERLTRAEVVAANAARPKRPLTLHDTIIRGLVARGHQTHEFLPAIGEALLLHDGVTKQEYREALDGLRILPDAYTIDPETWTITVYEVEVSHPVDDDKLARYFNLFWVVDQWEWSIRLVLVDKRGNERDVDVVRTGLEMELVEQGYPAPTAARYAEICDTLGMRP